MTDDSLKPDHPDQKSRSRKSVRKPRRKDSNNVPPMVAQAVSEAGILVVPMEKRRQVGRPRKQKPIAAVSDQVIGPDDPIVSGNFAQNPLAVPVGAPFTPVSARRVKSSAITPDVVLLRSSMLAPVLRDTREQTTRSWQWRETFAKAGRVLSWTLAVLRRHPRATGLVTTAILLGVSLGTIIVLSDVTEPERADRKIEQEHDLAGASAAVDLIMLPTRESVTDAAVSDALAGIRIVDPSWERKSSCAEGTWPYLEQHCLTKDESTIDAATENKIGPRMIDPGTRLNAAETKNPAAR